MQSFNPAVSHKRKERDITKLLMANYKVITKDKCAFEFSIEIQGPLDSLYTGGTWNLKIVLPDQYPYKSPSIGFENKIYHPNIDQASGTVCLDVLNQSWSPMFDLINVLEIFIPQLLQYPNPNHPLNVEAASLMLRDKEKYELKVKEMVLKHAVKTVLIEKKEPLDLNLKQLPTKYEDPLQNIALEINEEIMSQISLSDVSELSIIEENNEIMWQY